MLAVSSRQTHAVLNVGNQLVHQFLGKLHIGVLPGEVLQIPLGTGLGIGFLFLLLGLFGLVAVQLLFQLGRLQLLTGNILRSAGTLAEVDVKGFCELFQSGIAFLGDGTQNVQHGLLGGDPLQLGLQISDGLLVLGVLLLDPVIICTFLGKGGHFLKSDLALLFVDLDGEGFVGIGIAAVVLSVAVCAVVLGIVGIFILGGIVALGIVLVVGAGVLGIVVGFGHIGIIGTGIVVGLVVVVEQGTFKVLKTKIFILVHRDLLSFRLW